MGDRRVADALRGFVRVHRWDLIALAGICLLAAAFLSPSLVDGGSFGPFDYDTTLSSLGNGLYAHIHNSSNGDSIQQMVSWNALDWRMIHAGHFPLWNDYSGLGMPEFLNFESSVLSLPDIVSYLAPLRDAFLVAVFCKFVIAGTGAYVFARVLRLAIPAALFAGISFMFSGAFANWVTWPLSDVVAWTGWIAALVILTYRTAQSRWVIALAVAVAFSLFGGFPEANVMLVLILGALFAAAGLAAWACGRRPSPSGLVRAALGIVAGVALSSPLWFPGLQVLSSSHRTSEGDYSGLPIKSLPLLFSQGYYGEPFAGVTHYGFKNWNYYEATVYVGVPALAFAFIALLGARRRPIVIGLGFALVVAFVASYQPIGIAPFFRIVNHISGLSSIRFERTKAVGGFVIAVLGAIGFDDCWSAVRERRVVLRQWIGFAVVALVVAAVAVRTHGVTAAKPAYVPHERALIAPVLLVALLLVVGLAVEIARRRSPALAAKVRIGGMTAILVGQGAFVFIAGVGIPSYSHAFFPSTPAETRLQSIVGNGLVGLDGTNPTKVREYTHVGFYPEVNIGYGIRQFGIHDPLMPSAYFTSWPEPVTDATGRGVGLFTPDVDTVALARRYGIGFILALPGRPAPAGTEKVAVLAGETLYRVPDAPRFSFSAPGARVDSVSGSATDGFTIHTSGPSAGTLVLRVTAVPGWHASIDGRRVSLATYDGIMESARVPSGSHTIVLRYFPSRLAIGIVVSIATAVIGVGGWIVLARRRRTVLRRAITDDAVRV